MRFPILMILCAFMLPAAASAQDSLAVDAEQVASVDTVARYYVANCAGCHTIGGGNLSGPDLLATSAWPDGELMKRIKTMEDRVGPIDDEYLKALTALLKDSRVQERVNNAMQIAQRAVAAKLDPPDAQLGKNLYEGTKPLKNKGIACITCHRAGARGGSMGPDLTAVHGKLGQVALVSGIEQSRFKVMNGTYRKHAVTAQEAVHIAAYLAAPDMMPADSSERHVSVAGAIAAAIGFGGIIMLYRKRNRTAPKTLRRR